MKVCDFVCRRGTPNTGREDIQSNVIGFALLMKDVVVRVTLSLEAVVLLTFGALTTIRR
jgi:hypothetical protein